MTTTTKRTTTTATANDICKLVVVVMIMCSYVSATPMLYKKNTEHKFEADLVAVSSTVIPLTVLEVSYGLGGKPSEEYKLNYLKKLHKKVQHHDGASVHDNPDTLITVNKKHQVAKVKAMKEEQQTH